MKRNLLLLLTLLTAVTFTAAQDQVIKVGKKADIELGQETKVGDITLKPGHYRIQHRVSGPDHFVQFVQFKGHRSIMASGPATIVEAGELKCTIEPLPKKVDHTAVYTTSDGGMRKVTRVEIQGENVAHVF